MIKYIKNNTGAAKTWLGQEVGAGLYYLIGPSEEVLWANNSVLLIDIANAAAIVSKTDQTQGNITDVAEAINYLKGGLPKEVLTQAEKNDKDKRIAKGAVTVSVNNVGHIFIKCPGTINLDGNGAPIPNPNDDRWVNGGTIICNNAEDGDYIEVDVTLNTDLQNLIEAKSFTEAEESGDAKNGWYMDSTLGSLDLMTAAPAHMYAGFYLHIKYHAVNAGTTRKVYINLDWDLKS